MFSVQKDIVVVKSNVSNSKLGSGKLSQPREIQNPRLLIINGYKHGLLAPKDTSTLAFQKQNFLPIAMWLVLVINYTGILDR